MILVLKLNFGKLVELKPICFGMFLVQVFYNIEKICFIMLILKNAEIK